MPQAPQTTLTNNFIGGLKTEFTGLNFPENAATDTDNCIYTLIGEVLRREGIDYETNFVQNDIDRAGKAVTSFKWDNAGGDGTSQLIAIQVGAGIHFYNVSSSTIVSPLSTKKLSTVVNISSFSISGGSPDPSPTECQFATGNGFLFVFHPTLNPFYCTYDPGTNTVSTQVINIFIRDFDGIQLEGNGGHNDSRPVTLNGEMTYNLENQGWSALQFNKFNTDLSEFPANSDVWWRYINSSGVFDPLNTNGSVPFRNTPAPNGHFILEAFNQLKSSVSGGLPVQDIKTNFRPKTGTWFQGRVWYAGADASVPPFGDAPYYTWTEKIYFSQIAETPDYFGRCYQVNDPTDKFLFDELPSDGGVITIQGCGSVYKLFPVQNGLLVFAANGIWFITGSQGIGFAANDYTITKISSIQSISPSSFVNVLGWPVFWNEEGIYTVTPSQQGGGLTVENLTLGSILSFYADIPLQSKKFVKGAYNPIDYIIQWTYRSTNESNVTTRYEYDKILNLNTSNKAFYPYTIANSTPKINGVVYVSGPGGSTAPDPVFKYIISKPEAGSYKFSFAEELDNTHYKDWFKLDSTGIDYTSFFITGYRIHGQGTRMWQPGYLYVYTQGNTAYKIQNIWDYASNTASGRWSTQQVVNNVNPNYGSVFRRHRLRGHGLVNQIKVSSVTGQPFNIYGWTVWELQNTGV